MNNLDLPEQGLEFNRSEDLHWYKIDSSQQNTT